MTNYKIIKLNNNKKNILHECANDQHFIDLSNK